MYEAMAKEAARQGDHARAAELLDVMNAKYSGATVYRTLIPGERLKAVSPDHRSFANPVHVSFLPNYISEREADISRCTAALGKESR